MVMSPSAPMAEPSAITSGRSSKPRRAASPASTITVSPSSRQPAATAQ